jgi:hypothetical protein
LGVRVAFGIVFGRSKDSFGDMGHLGKWIGEVAEIEIKAVVAQSPPTLYSGTSAVELYNHSLYIMRLNLDSVCLWLSVFNVFNPFPVYLFITVRTDGLIMPI